MLKYVNNQHSLLLLFSIVLVLPNILQIHTGSYSVYTIISNLMLPYALGVFLLALFSKPGIMVLILLPKLVLDAYQLIFFHLFGKGVVTTDMFLNTVTTNVKESSELLFNIYPVVLLIVAIYILLLVLAVQSLLINKKLATDYRKKLLLTSIFVSLLCETYIMIVS